MNYPQIKPTLNLDFSNTKTLDPRINFRRGTPGAYYDGKTYAKAEENLIDYSEDFSQWGFGRLVQTASQSAPDGSTDAYKIEQESGQTVSGYLLQTHSTSANKSYTFSVYAKAGTNRNYIALRTYLSSLSNRFTYFDLVNGEAVNVDDRHVASISDTGNGWYRCSITYTPISSSSVLFNVYFSDNDSSITVADDGGFIYLWGAQLEQRDSVTAYTPTTGTPITKYQPQLMFASPDQPRFDHDVLTGESKGLLIEEGRTNLVWYSENFEDFAVNHSQGNFNESGWAYIRCSLDTNGPISPDGTTHSVIMEHDTNETSGGGLYMSAFSGWNDKYIPAGTNTYSWYAKNAGVNFFVINTGGDKVFFDLTNGTAKSFATLIDSYGIEHVGNGWYRCHVVTSQATNLFFYQSDQDSDGSSTVSGAGGVAVWGPQFEQGSFLTSYIKTSGASATRSADNASITGENFSSWYRQDEGSIYVDSTKGNLGTSFAGYFSLHTEDFSNSEYYWLLHNSSDQFQFLVAPAIASLTDGVDVSLGSQKACVSWADDDFSMSVNGGAIQSDTSGPAKKNLAGLRIGFSPYSNSHYLNSAIKKLSYYPQRLTNEQLQQLTK